MKDEVGEVSASRKGTIEDDDRNEEESRDEQTA